MKKTLWGLMTFFLVILIGCGSGYSGSGNSQNNPSNSGAGNSSSSSNSGNTQPKPKPSDTDVINIPSQSQPAPNGILEQISWGAVGGPGGLSPCGNCNVDISGSTLVMSGFDGDQKILLLIYRRTSGPIECAEGTAEYVASLIVQVDSLGYKEIDVKGADQDLLLIAFDATTDKPLWRDVPYDDVLSICSATSSGSCPGAPPQRLNVDEMAYVCTVADSVKLREGPGKNYSVIKSLVPGADLKIIGGPTCADNWSWWKVETESGYVGWMSEGGDSVDRYFLCPRK
jgi:hypothetical protein